MKLQREALWTVVVSAILVTSGLILSCGDDAAPTCQDVCEKMVEECEGMFDESWDTVEECVEDCEEPEEWEEVERKCIVDVPCDDLMEVCARCATACKFVNNCEFDDLPGGVEDLDTCYEDCKEKEDGIMFEIIQCIIDNESICDNILDCFE